MEQDINIIYLFGYSEMTGNHLGRLMPLLKAQLTKDSKIGVILIHDGVIGTSTKGKIPEALKELLDSDIKIHAMIPDLRARGIHMKHVHEKITPIEYEEFVDIIDNSQKVISWM